MFSTSAPALRSFNVMNNCVACVGFMLETGVCVLFKIKFKGHYILNALRKNNT